MYFSRSSMVGYRTDISYIHDVFYILFVWPGVLLPHSKLVLSLTPPSAWGYTEPPFCVEFSLCLHGFSPSSPSFFLPLCVVNLSASPWSCRSSPFKPSLIPLPVSRLQEAMLCYSTYIYLIAKYLINQILCLNESCSVLPFPFCQLHCYQKPSVRWSMFIPAV